MIKVKNSSLRNHFLVVLFLGSACLVKAQQGLDLKVKFVNVQNEKLREAFLEVLSRYESLHQYDIVLTQATIKGSTMQAQPLVSAKSVFAGVKRFKVKVAKHVRDSEDQLVNELPKDVLIGWFAHELGHLVDYEPYNNFQMIDYGLKYLISPKFKRKAEYAADYIAIENGFKKEILASKRYILESGLLSPAYVKKISKYYLSIADVELCSQDRIVVKPATGQKKSSLL